MATLRGGLAHDVSILPGLGRQLGSQSGANTSMTIMRPPQRGQGQGSTRGVSVAISGGSCGAVAGGATLRSARAVAMTVRPFERRSKMSSSSDGLRFGVGIMFGLDLMIRNEAAERIMIARRLRHGVSGRGAMSGVTKLTGPYNTATKLAC